jgi:lysophospholipase L1-like esterase
MATRLSFVEFDAKLKSGTLTPAEHRKYLEVDPAADVVRVRFKPGALRDAPPPGYDVDRELYLAERAKQERQIATLALVGLNRVVAEGDSWFNLPPFIRPEAIADRLKSNNRLAVKNIAHWGDTLTEMLKAKEYLPEIPKFNPDWFIFSAGGNDLQESLKRGELLLPHDPNRPIDQCLSTQGVSLLQEIAEGYRTLLNEIALAHPTLPSICYAYDFPRPTYKSGKYIGQYIKKMGYPKGSWDAVAKVIIDRLTVAIEPVAKSFPNAQFLDCRGTTTSYPFFDDMHPNTDGFKALARQFEKAFGVALAPVAKPRARRRPAPTRKAAKSKSKGTSRGARARSARGATGKVAKTRSRRPSRGR